VDQHLSDRKEVPAMQAVLGGKFAQQVICRGVPFRSEKQDDFFQACAGLSLFFAMNPCPAVPARGRGRPLALSCLALLSS
jgi:hypothetical protein